MFKISSEWIGAAMNGIRARLPKVPPQILLGTGGAFAVAVAVYAAIAGPLQIAIVLIGVLIALIMHSRAAVIIFVICMVPSLSLVRRLAAGDSAYLDSDPLILLPVVLAVGVIVFSWSRPRTDERPAIARALAVVVILGVTSTIVLRGAFSLDGLFFAGLIIVPMLLAIVLSTGRLPPLWPATSRVVVWLAVAAGIYGIVQFLVLPSWDRAWMISSGLTSIGSPYPQQVRVFGASESPGPYAVFLGIGLTLSLCMAVLTKSVWLRFGWLLASAGIAVPLILSGVRSSLLGVVVCVALLALTRAKGFSRVALVLFLIAGYQALIIVVGRFSGQSTILNQDRYSDFSNDASLLARLTLLRYLANPFTYLVGNPNATGVDNLYIDVLVRYGLVPAAALFALVVLTAVRATQLLRRHQSETAALCIWFLLVQSMFGNIFNALVGILIGIIIGTVNSRTGGTANTRAIRGVDARALSS